MQLIFVVSLVIMACIVVARDGKRGKRKGSNPNCTSPWDDGPCRAQIPRYYFDPVTKKCSEFMYGGCGGNGNNYESEKECLEKCRGKKGRKPNNKGKQ
uniref:Putative salivary kunitz domain protein n=1 Tax=Ixodes ricinus TaxID=34613 RepID=A0A0K8R5G7_IXORI